MENAKITPFFPKEILSEGVVMPTMSEKEGDTSNLDADTVLLGDRPVPSASHSAEPQDVKMLQVSADDDVWFAQQGLPSNLLTWSERVDQEDLDLLEETASTSMDLRYQEAGKEEREEE